MIHRSHPPASVRAAVATGATAYQLDTGSAGADDVLLADPGESREDVLRDVLAFFELDQLPEGWTLDAL